MRVVVNTLVTLPLAIPPVVCIKILGQDKSSTIGSDLNFEIWPHSHIIHRHTATDSTTGGGTCLPQHRFEILQTFNNMTSLEMVQTLTQKS